MIALYLMALMISQAPVGELYAERMLGLLKSEKVAAELNLTPEQRKKLVELASNHEKKVVDLRAEIQKKTIDLNNILRTENYNRKQIEPLIKEIANLEAELRVLRLMHMAEVRNVLTPDQVNKLRERFQIVVRQEIREKMRERIDREQREENMQRMEKQYEYRKGTEDTGGRRGN